MKFIVIFIEIIFIHRGFEEVEAQSLVCDVTHQGVGLVVGSGVVNEGDFPW